MTKAKTFSLHAALRGQMGELGLSQKDPCHPILPSCDTNPTYYTAHEPRKTFQVRLGLRGLWTLACLF